MKGRGTVPPNGERARYADAGMDHKEGGCYMFRLDKQYIIDATVSGRGEVSTLVGQLRFRCIDNLA